MSNPDSASALPLMSCGSTTFEWGLRTYIMGIVNVTPDSFSGDGVLDPHLAIAHGLAMVEAGADILDVGGESTRPGADPLDVDDELARVIPVVQGLVAATSTPISVDTSRSAVAEAALDAGAHIINDVWGFHRDPLLAGVVARHQAWAVAMHNRTAPARQAALIGGYFPQVHYDDLMAEIAHGLRQSIEVLTRAGVALERIILDPGIGFGKTPSHNLEIINRLDELRSLGRPLLVGPSRKSFIGLTLSLPPEDRVEGTAAAVAILIARGADVVRVHDLPAMSRVARMSDAITRRSPPS